MAGVWRLFRNPRLVVVIAFVCATGVADGWGDGKRSQRSTSSDANHARFTSAPASSDKVDVAGSVAGPSTMAAPAIDPLTLANPAAWRADMVSVFVHFAPIAGAVTPQLAADRRNDVDAWAANVGGHVKYEYETVLPNAINLRRIPRAQLGALAAMPGVVKVEEDRVMHAYLTVSTPLIRALQSQITGAGLAADGSGVRVCVIDTGIDNDHIMYASRIDSAAGRDFANNDNNPEDDNGHGANVAGIAVGGTGIFDTRCSVSTELQGVAPAATLIGIKVLDANGSGFNSDVIAGINYAADQTGAGGRCDVINLSLGGGTFAGVCDGDSSAIAVNNAEAAGVVVIAAAGNEANADALGSPACASGAIAVGAVFDNDFPNCENAQSTFSWCGNAQCTTILCTDSNITVDSLICFSNRSSQLDVTAPGCDARSAGIAAGGTTFASQCGTSQASPHVAGLAALLLGVDSNLTPSEVRQLIRDGAIDMGPAGFDIGYGFGRVDAVNSLSLLTPCTGDPDCDDSDSCTVDACTAGSCSNTPIGCSVSEICAGGVCVPQGACCAGAFCDTDTLAGCAASGGTYLGDATVCGGGAAGSPTVYQSTPNVAIPDGGGPGDPVTDTINVPNSFPIGDLNVGFTIAHTWVGDVTVTVSHLGTTVMVLDRPGVPASQFGCGQNNFSGVILDDDGAGGTVETQCAPNLASPPNYTPNNPLSAFDGMDSGGPWTISVYDSALPDPGTLNAWSLHIDELGSNPCTAACLIDTDCDDGVACTFDSCDTIANLCVNDPIAPCCGNGTCDAGEDCATCAADCADGGSCANTCERCDAAQGGCVWCSADVNQSGFIDGLDFGFFSGCFGSCYTGADPCLAANLDCDPQGCVGGLDFAAFSGCFGGDCASCAACVCPAP